MQNLEDQKRQNKQQYTLIKKRQKILSEKTKNALGKLEEQKDAALKAKDNVLYDRLLAKEKKIRKYYRERKEELSSLRTSSSQVYTNLQFFHEILSVYFY